MFYALICYSIAQSLIFYQQNITKIDPDVTKIKFHMAMVLISLPVTYLYYYSWNAFANLTGSVWSARFIFFGLSYLVFPFLAYYILNENMFTAKNFACIALSLLIVYIQFKF